VNANLALGQQQMAAKKYKDALAAFQDALQVPANLQEAAGNTAGRRGEIEYYIGTAYEAAGEKEKAAAAFTEAAGPAAADTGAAGRGGRGGRGGAGLPPGQFSGRGAMGGVASGTHEPDAAAYFQALALQKLGRADESKALFQQILDSGNRAVAAAALPGSTAVVPAATRTAIADAHYLAALGNMGLAYTDKARAELTVALKISPDHLAAHVAMMQLPAETHVGQK
jgi:tetratricopeptide (TPR) repeat protein